MNRVESVGGIGAGTRVAAPNGWRPIEELSPGDSVFGIDGRPTRVVQVDRTFGRTCQMTLSDRTAVITAVDQPCLINRSDRLTRNRKWLLVPAADVVRPTTLPSGRLRWLVPVGAALVNPDRSLPLNPYLLGVLLGDGCFAGMTPTITTADPDMPWTCCLPVGTRISPSGPPHHRSYRIAGEVWRHNPVTIALREMDLWGLRGWDKFVPLDYLTAGTKQRWDLLQGLADTDGTPLHSGAIEYTTVSSVLADGVMQLARSLGAVATMSIRSPRPPHREAFRICIWLPAHSENPFRRVRKAQRWSPRRTRMIRAVQEVISSGEGPLVRIEVKGSTLVLEGGIVAIDSMR